MIKETACSCGHEQGNGTLRIGSETANSIDTFKKQRFIEDNNIIMKQINEPVCEIGFRKKKKKKKTVVSIESARTQKKKQ
jgi:hypothetical protein